MTAFPNTWLDVRAELSLGTWTDITPYLFLRAGEVAITRGHPDETTTTNPSATKLRLDNTAGRFNEYNPAGPYYGLIGRNTPLRISVPEGASYLRSETDQASYASCPDTAGVSITGDTEVQLDVTLDNWQANTSLAGKWTSAGNERSWLLLLNENMTLTFAWSPDGTTIITATSAVGVPVPALRRQGLRVTLAVASGTVTFYTAPALANQVTIGPVTSGWVQLGAAVVAGANSVFDSTAPVCAGYAAGDADFGYPGLYGKVHRLALLSGIGGTVKASPDFTVQAAGASSFADGESNAWTLAGTAEISARKYRGHFEVASWPPTWDPTGTDVQATVSGSGVLRRLAQGNSPVNSAMYRYWTKLAGSAAPVAYWPCEDGPGSTQIASGIGGRALMIAGSPNLAADNSFACSAPLPQLNGSTWYSQRLPSYTDTGTLVIRFALNVASGLSGNAVLTRFDLTGPNLSANPLYLYWSGGTLTLFGTGTIASVALAAATPVEVSVEFVFDTGNGGEVGMTLRVMTLGGAITSNGPVFVLGTIGQLAEITVNPVGDISAGWSDPGKSVIGHIGMQTALTPLSALASPLAAWAAERAGNRFARLCAEEGIACRIQGNADTSTPMGPQTQQTITQLFQEVADADRGTITEPRQVLGLGYRCRNSLLHQSPAITLDYAQGEVSPPMTLTDDDQYTINDVTVARSASSSASKASTSRAIAQTGPLSVQPPPNGVGTYDTQVTVNLAYDRQLDSHAGWLLHLGTVDEPRYPQITIDLANTALDPVVLWAAQDADIADYLAVINGPVWLPPGAVRQLAQGLTENLSLKGWVISWQGIPESPYETAQAGTAHADTDGSALHASITSGATSMLADSTGALWTSAVTPDATSTASSLSTTTLTWTHVMGAGSGGILLVFAGYGQSAAPTVSGVTYAGQALTKLASEDASPGNTHDRAADIWYLLGPPPGSASVAVTMSAGSSSIVCAAASFLGVSQSAPFGTPAAADSSSASSLSAATSGGAGSDTVVAVCHPRATGTPTSGASQSQVVNFQQTGSTNNPIVVTTQPGSPSGVTSSFAWTSGADFAAMIAVALRAAAAADFPFDITMGGERATVTAIAGTTSPQGFTLARSVNGVVKAQAAGTPISLFTPPVVPL
jgi:hypothetical protein